MLSTIIATALLTFLITCFIYEVMLGHSRVNNAVEALRSAPADTDELGAHFDSVIKDLPANQSIGQTSHDPAGLSR